MIYESLFEQAGRKQISAGLIGTGTYGISLLAQSQHIPRLNIPVICDQDPQTARNACILAGIPEDSITICSNRNQVLLAIEKGRCAIAENYELMLETSLQVIVESTGNPEAGARHAEAAIQNGKHVAMVTKEADSAVGPVLNQLAEKAGVVYTPVDGDQHGLLMGFASWAESLGLEIICGGKARPYDFVYNEAARSVSNGAKELTLPDEDMTALEVIADGQARSIIPQRRRILNALSQIGVADLCESVIAANATGLIPDIPSLHASIVRITEIADVLCPGEDGGILENRGIIDVITCLRREDEAGLGGGVFLVFGCKNDDTWKFIREKGLIVNQRGTCGLVYRPYHLLGVETPISILCAGLLNLSTGSLQYKPRLDLIVKIRHELNAGSKIPLDHEDNADLFEYRIVPASPVDKENPIPFYMAAGNQVSADVPAGTTITCDMIAEPEDSRLWELRRQQDQTFAGVLE
ncbi:MAG: flagellar biosynthesis protein FlgA [Deltaproteobacteria bacterium]|jgi:predicted homoserine dehydrogenase-like protein|nr:flagellar biosynthesis protein FlgA [Deltaproteobacteria bacterium]